MDSIYCWITLLYTACCMKKSVVTGGKANVTLPASWLSVTVLMGNKRNVVPPTLPAQPAGFCRRTKLISFLSQKTPLGWITLLNSQTVKLGLAKLAQFINFFIFRIDRLAKNDLHLGEG